MPEIKGDYQGRLKTLKATVDAKLETVTAIASGTVSVNDIGRIGTVGIIDALGSIANTSFDIGHLGTIGDISHLGSIANTAFDVGRVGTVGSIENLGSIVNAYSERLLTEAGDSLLQENGDLIFPESGGQSYFSYTLPKADRGDMFYNLRCNRDRDLVTAPGWTGSRRVKLLTDDAWRLMLATLGTVEKVNVIGSLGTVSTLDTVGMIESGTISEVGHLGTIGAINHLGSIANTSFDIGRVGTVGSITTLGSIANTSFDIGRVGTVAQIEPMSGRTGGKRTVTTQGTPVGIKLATYPANAVVIKALHANAGEIYVGDSNVGSDTGFILQKDEWVSLSCSNAGSVYIDRNAGTQGVSYLIVME